MKLGFFTQPVHPITREYRDILREDQDAVLLADELGYPLVVRPSYVLGGRAMEIVQDGKDLERYMREAVKVSNSSPVLLDRFLDDAIESTSTAWPTAARSASAA